MSNTFTTVISGTGVFAVPTDDASLAAASAGLSGLLSGVPDLTYDSCLAFVRDDDGGGVRSLNCLLTNVQYGGAVCPSAASTQSMLAAIKAALLVSLSISSVDVQQISIVEQSGGGTVSFPGIQNVWFVDKGSNTTTDGSVQQPFHSIQDALSVSSDGDTVLVYPGIYVEQIAPVTGVSVRGTDQFTCILENTGLDALTYPLADTPVGEWHIENMQIRATGGDGSIIHRFGNNAPLGITHEFIDCQFTGGQFQETTHRSMTSALFLRCRSMGDTNGFNMTGDLTAGRQMRLRFSEHVMDCSPIFTSTHGAGGTQIICFNATRPGDASTPWTVEGDWDFASGASWVGGNAGGLRFGSTGALSLYLSYIDGGVLFTKEPGSVEVVNCVFNVVPGGRGDMDVDVGGPSQVVVNRYSGNAQQNGLVGAIVIPSSERAVGGSQPDRYMSLQDALMSIYQHDTVVRLREDVTLTEPLRPNAYRQKIEGDGKHTLAGAPGFGNVIVSVGDYRYLEFENIELSGRMDIDGPGAKLLLGHNVGMFGAIFLAGGDGNTLVQLDHTRLEGTSEFHYPIVIQNAAPALMIEGDSVVIGGSTETGYEAIRWEVDNKNVQIKYSTLTHGSLGVGNNPFINAVGGSIGYSSHHSVYNADPATGGSFNNAVAVNYDIYDTAAVF